jgi:hypothetical protein
MFFEQIMVNIEDAFQLGLMFPMRHLAAALGARDYHTKVRGAGEMTIRAHTSDASVVRQVFAAKDYDLHRFAQFDSIQKVYQAIIDSGKTPLIIDAGANIGVSVSGGARHRGGARACKCRHVPREYHPFSKCTHSSGCRWRHARACRFVRFC